MCGIAGIYARHLPPDARATVEKMLDELKLRGPDHTAIQQLDQPDTAAALFGHNRLSIIDLLPEGNQPMWDREHRLSIIYNGEIYNYIELRRELIDLGHEFVTQSDTEVILEAFKQWGIECLNRLNGMFAFALFDCDSGRLWLARDRFGVKPLYYALTGSQLVFSSTPGPLARRLNLQPNLAYVARGIHFLLFEDDGPIAPYEGMSAVPAGHYTMASAANGSLELRVVPYYDFRARVSELSDALASVKEAELVDRLKATLESAIALRLRADVPVAISLSGGLDSSSIAAIVAQQHAAVTGFSFGKPQVTTSEGPLVAAVVEQTGIGATYVWPDIRDRIRAFWETLAAQDAPFTELSMVAQFLVCRAAHAEGFKVLLGGQGGDEVLMGYRKFQVMLFNEALCRKDLRSVIQYGSSLAPMLAAEAPRAAMYLRQWSRYTRTEGLSTKLHLPPPAPLELRAHPAEPTQIRQALDVTRLSLPTLLRYEDRSSMANSLETRLPFLDYRLAEFAVALPDHLKVRGGYGKWALRQAMRGRLPEAITRARYKRGFDTAQGEWMSSGLGPAIRAELREKAPVVRNWLPRNVDIDEAFSDRRLAIEASAITEATSLLWLAKHA